MQLALPLLFFDSPACAYFPARLCAVRLELQGPT